jgi:hypothetical protein
MNKLLSKAEEFYMNVQCECGKFRAELKTFPENTPGRLKCYCDDCQIYLHYLKRSDLLDINGGSEMIPVYPADVEILSGKEMLVCTRLSKNGMFRFSTSCCNTPVANTKPNTPWIGFHSRVFTVKDPDILSQKLGPIRSSVMGRFAKGTPPPGTPQNLNLNAVVSVVPFILKGKLLRKSNPSPFFKDDKKTAIVDPYVLNTEELHVMRAAVLMK